MIKAVVFDMGGVMLRLDINRSIEAFKQQAGFEEIGEYLNVFHQKGFVGELEAGRITADEFVDECLRHSRPGTSRETVLACFDAFLDGLNMDVVNFIQEIAPRYDLYILSNNNPLSSARFAELMEAAGVPVDRYFKKCFFSYRLHQLKPFPEIYQSTIEGIGLPPEEILFIDDSATNIEAAARAGLRTLLYRPGMDLRAASRAAFGIGGN